MTSNIYSNNTIIGNWEIIELIWNKYKTQIYEVENINIKNDKIKWVMKISNNSGEIDIINKLNLYKEPNIISMPILDEDRYGKYNNEFWCVMEKYDGDVYDFQQYCWKNINKLGLYLINFLEWLHIKKHKIHGDIKIHNIVVSITDSIINNFSIIDFENMSEPYSQVYCSEDLPDDSYYYSIGCQLNKNYFSYRMDLQSVGYILCYLLEAEEEHNNLLDDLYYDSVRYIDWKNIAVKYYKSNTKYNYFNEIEIIRDKHTKNMPKIIKNYFNIIEKLDWECLVPNSEIYIELKKLFI